MEYLVGIGILIAILYLSVRYKAVRYVVLGLIAVLALGAVIIYSIAEQREREYEKEVALSKQRIPIGEVEFLDITMGGDYTIKARIKNHSALYGLTEIKMTVTLVDDNGVSKDIVGQTDVILNLDVPPKQVREIEEHVFFTDLGSPRGKRSWHHKVTYVRGEQK
jgi:hypothetical protein